MPYTEIKVLVVDDDPTTRRIIKKIAAQIGFTDIVEAENGAEAFAKVQEQEFGLILSDWDMPVMNGMEFLEKVRKDERYTEIPFIMITANDTRENIILAAKARVSQYIVKPFTVQALKAKIDKVLLVS